MAVGVLFEEGGLRIWREESDTEIGWRIELVNHDGWQAVVFDMPEIRGQSVQIMREKDK